jgi:hypothetical protein
MVHVVSTYYHNTLIDTILLFYLQVVQTAKWHRLSSKKSPVVSPVSAATAVVATTVVATVAVPAAVNAVGPGNAQSRRLEWRAAERRGRETMEVAAAEEGLRRVGLRLGGRRAIGELESKPVAGARMIFDPRRQLIEHV